MTIVTADELTAYMGGLKLSTDQLGIVETVILPGLQQELELFLNRPLEPVQVRESVMPDQMGFVTLKITPVWKVNSAIYSQSGTAITTRVYYPPAWSEDPSVDRRIDYSGVGMTALPWRMPVQAFGLSALDPFGWGRYVIVDYIGGYLGLQNQALKLAMLRVAAREVQNQFDDTVGVRSGALEVATPNDTRRKGWMPEELAALARLRRRVIR